MLGRTVREKNLRKKERTVLEQKRWGLKNMKLQEGREEEERENLGPFSFANTEY